MTDKRIIGEHNELAILVILHRFGWLTARMVAALVWPTHSQSLSMARRTLRRMLDAREVAKRRLPEGGDCYVLTSKGAHRLTVERGITAKSGQHLKLGNSVHRACCNWYVIEHLRKGATVWTEHEIQSGRSPVTSWQGKTPDALIDTQCGLIWVETENAWKNRTERQKLVEFCARNLGHLDTRVELADGYPLFMVAIVATNRSALENMVASFRESARQGLCRDAHLAEIEVVLVAMDRSLIPNKGVGRCLWYDIIEPTLHSY